MAEQEQSGKTQFGKEMVKTYKELQDSVNISGRDRQIKEQVHSDMDKLQEKYRNW